MKTLQIIKDEYAKNKHLKNWEHFCLVANDNMFIQAVDDIAELFTKSRFVEKINFTNSKMPNSATIGLFRSKNGTLQFNNLK